MKIQISTKHVYLSGWTVYDMTWKTEFTGVRNKTIQSLVVASKEPFSTNVLKKWALAKGYDLDAIFTDVNRINADCKMVNNLSVAFNNEYGKHLDELNSINKCYVSYTATPDTTVKPFETAFETFQAYDVNVRVEFKSGVIEGVFPSVGRMKDTACTRIVFSGGKMKAVYEEQEAIENVKSEIERYINDCDTDDKFVALSKKLREIRARMMKR